MAEASIFDCLTVYLRTANQNHLVILRNFFRRHEPSVPVTAPELVSVHIPKTAGTSFRHILKQVYGEAAVVRLDIGLKGDRVRLNEKPYGASRLPDGTRVAHGHFTPGAIRAAFPGTAKLPMITWLRHPVERVISNYFYLKKRLAEELDEEAKGLNILRKMQRTLMEYARDEMNRNRQHKFLEGMALDDFEFVGIQEHYDEDLAAMARHFGWANAEAVAYNVTGTGPVVSAEDRAEIAELNALDMALYHRGLHLRARRTEKPTIELISLHVPKTGGTSFYRSLHDVYGPEVTGSLRRVDVARLTNNYPDWLTALPGDKRVLHGHVRYAEVADLAQDSRARVIAWLREPVARVVSNYRFFRAGLTDPDRNPAEYARNRHRADEDLLTYARRPENRNLMSRYLAGRELTDYFFIGLLEHYATDLAELADLLHWPDHKAYRLNEGAAAGAGEVGGAVDETTRAALVELNADDVALYQKILALRAANNRPV